MDIGQWDFPSRTLDLASKQPEGHPRHQAGAMQGRDRHVDRKNGGAIRAKLTGLTLSVETC